MNCSVQHKLLLCVLASALMAPPGIGAQEEAEGAAEPDLLERAAALESEDRPSDAAAAYRQWLGLEPADQDLYVDVLSRYLRVEKDTRRAEQILLTALEHLGALEHRIPTLRTYAALLEAMGELEGAQAAYHEAGTVPDLVISARLLYELGRLDAAETEARAAGSEPAPATLLLLGRIEAARGNFEEALQTYTVLTEDPRYADVAPAALLGAARIHAAGDDAAALQATVARLLQHYPASPEYALAAALAGSSLTAPVHPPAKPSLLLGPYVGVAKTDGRTTRKAAAAAVLGAGQKPTAPVTPESEPPPPAPEESAGDSPAGGVVVLAGSYTAHRNALSRVDDLGARGIEASIAEAVVNGKRYFRVIVGEADTYESASQRALVLKDKGIESVLLFLD